MPRSFLTPATTALVAALFAAGTAQAQWRTLDFGRYRCSIYGAVVTNGPEVGTAQAAGQVDIVLDGSWEHLGARYPTLLGVYKKSAADKDYDLRTAAQGQLITLQIIFRNRPGYSQDATCQYQGQ